MITIYKHEIEMNMKSLLIWFAGVGGMGFACILLYSNLQGEMGNMAESFASMGAFADAFGMSQLSIATLAGYYATEIGTIHGLGGAMFAAVISTSMLSKEEDGHTSEFLYSLPIARGKVVFTKWCTVVTNVALFNLLCVIAYVLGIIILQESIPAKQFILYHALQVMMQIEFAAICYAVSASKKKNQLGLGLGIVLLCYAFDLMTKVIPDLADWKIISPFSFANASAILSTGDIYVSAMVFGIVIQLMSMCLAFVVYIKRDLAV